MGKVIGMSKYDRTMVKCDVVMGEANPYGQYANAFRIVPGPDNEVFLDFCVYTNHTNTAQVVARVRVAVDFLPTVQERIARDVNLLPASPKNMLFLMNLVGGNGDN